MTTLLISGSRDATPAMCTYARACVARAYAQGWDVICGDAVGIDQVVAEAVREINADAPADEWRLFCDIYGLAAEARHGIAGKGLTYRQLTTVQMVTYGKRDVHVYPVKIETYAQRDKIMVQKADKVMCIWNGSSRGTLAVYKHALQCGKEAWLRRDC